MYSTPHRYCAFYLSATHVSRLANSRLQCSVGGGVSDARAEKLCPLWVLGQDDGEFDGCVLPCWYLLLIVHDELGWVWMFLWGLQWVGSEGFMPLAGT
jgi:hypothetical protein